jgi:hypothetical protein
MRQALPISGGRCGSMPRGYQGGGLTTVLTPLALPYLRIDDLFMQDYLYMMDELFSDKRPDCE